MSVRALHTTLGVYTGECVIARGRGVLASLALRFGRFPPAGQSVPVRLRVQQQGRYWYWSREFGGHETQSVLNFDTKRDSVCERFGALRVWLKPYVDDDELRLEIRRLTLFGLPCPRFLLPRSSTTEWQDERGRFRFDVSADLPAFGMLIRYHGWLTPFHGEDVVR